MKLFLRTAASLLATMALTAGAGAFAQAETAKEMGNLMTPQEIEKSLFTPEVMWKMGRIGSSAVSPDGRLVAYTITYYSVDDNKGVTSLYLMNADGSNSRRVTDLDYNASDPTWGTGGSKLYFLGDKGGEGQVWALDMLSSFDNQQPVQVTRLKGGIDGYGVSPQGDKLFYVKKVRTAKHESKDVHPDMDKSKALIYDDLMARHWNYWERGDYSHIFIADISGGEGKDIMPGETWDAPMAPYFDIAEIAWNNAGTQLAYTCKKLNGRLYAESTDSDIYLYDLAGGTTVNLTEGMPGYDKYPVFSPDDSKIAFRSMARPGNEADKDRLFVVDLKTGEKTYITKDFDYNAENVVWEGNDKLYFISPIHATFQICRADLKGKVEVLTDGDHDITSFTKAGDLIVYTRTTLASAAEIYSFGLKKGGTHKQISFVNKDIYDNVTMGEVQKRFVKTTDGKDMLTWMILPPNFDASQKYPVLLYCQGGPQNVVSQSFSFRWNYQLMAAQGYIIVAPNRRGLPSFGQEWLDQISGDYSGQNIRDYLSAIDDVSKEPWADETRMGCVGASYGGYSAFYLAGVHEGRFKGFISHCGIYNFESMYGSTEELFFPNNDYGGPYWMTADNADEYDDRPWRSPSVVKRSYDNSPHKLAGKWDTPILIITGLNDFRVPYTQSLEAFTAARVQGIPAKLVAFENEAHQVFKPQNSIVWNREFFGWLRTYVKHAGGKRCANCTGDH